METETITLVKTLMSLRGMSQTELARKAKVARTCVSKYLNGDSDLRSESLVKITTILGANLDSIIKTEINRALGQGEANTIGEDIQFLLSQAPPIDRRTFADTLVAKFKNNKNLETRTRVTRIKKYRDSIKTVRG